MPPEEELNGLECGDTGTAQPRRNDESDLWIWIYRQQQALSTRAERPARKIDRVLLILLPELRWSHRVCVDWETEKPRQHLLKRGRKRRLTYFAITRAAHSLRNNMRSLWPG